MEQDQREPDSGGPADGRSIDDTAAEHDGLQDASTAPTIGAHVQDVLRGIMEFVRGRDAHEHDHDRER